MPPNAAYISWCLNDCPFLPSRRESYETSPTPRHPFNSGRLLNNSQLHLATDSKIKTKTLHRCVLYFIPIFNAHLFSQFHIFCSATSPFFSLLDLTKGKWDGRQPFVEARKTFGPWQNCLPPVNSQNESYTRFVREILFGNRKKKSYIFSTVIAQAVISTRQQKGRETINKRECQVLPENTSNLIF